MTLDKSLTLETFVAELNRLLERSVSMYVQAKEEIYTFRELFRRSGNRRFLAWMDWLDRIFEANAKEAVKHLDHYLAHSEVDKRELLIQASGFIHALAEPPEYVLLIINMLREDEFSNTSTLRRKLLHLRERAEEVLSPYQYLAPPPPEPEPRIMVNNTIVGSHIHGSVTQAGGDVSQGLPELDFDAVRRAVKDALVELERSKDSPEVRNLVADMSTVSAQLGKSSISRSILVEARASMRSIIENIAAGLLTPGAGSALERVVSLLSKL